MIGEFRFLYFRIIHEVESGKTYLRTPNVLVHKIIQIYQAG